MSSNPTISIITPIYNSQDFLEETIQSIINQTYSDWELLIIDDCSSDNSYEKAKKFAAKDPRIHVNKLGKNSGGAVSRNKGIELATGRYIAFLDSDDLWEPEKLKKQLKFMQEGNYDFSYTSFKKVDESGNLLGTQSIPEKVTYNDVLKETPIGCLTAMYDTKNLGKVYMPIIRKRQDLALWLKILKMVPLAYGLNQPLATYRIRNNSVSSNKKMAALYTWKVYREIENLSLIKSIYVFCHYALRGFLKYKAPWLARLLKIHK